jgi:hypothetical protein
MPEIPVYPETMPGANPVIPEVSFRCRDIIWIVPLTLRQRGSTVRNFIDHAESSHNLPFLSADLFLKEKKSMK